VTATVSIQTLGLVSPDLHSLGNAAGYLGAALGVGMVVPQIVRTFRNRTRPGVSALTWALTALSCFTWMLYGFRAGEVPQIPGNILIVTGAVIIVLAVPALATPAERAVRLALPAAALVGLAIVLPPAAVGFIGFGIGLVAAVPQTVQSIRRPASSTSAVSIPAWLLRAASQVAWLAYALAHHDITVTISASFLLVSAVFLVVLESRRRPSEFDRAALAVAQSRA
jgi:uncharacterized protein with PQ loop repeat